MTTALDRFAAASININAAVEDAVGVLADNSELDALRNAKTALEAEVAQLKSDAAALIVAHENELDRVSMWAEGVIAKIRQHVPAKA